MTNKRHEAALTGFLPRILPRGFLSGEERLEEAVTFLVRALESKVKRGKKPVILHSLRVGFYLMNAGHSQDVVIAGMLHDVLEKTSYTEAQLARRFNPHVAVLVAATTNNTRIECSIERYADSIRRCAKIGEDALLVRAADLIDNCDRLLAHGNDSRLGRLAEKLRLLIKVCRDETVDQVVVDDLHKRLRRIARRAATVTIGGGK